MATCKWCHIGECWTHQARDRFVAENAAAIDRSDPTAAFPTRPSGPNSLRDALGAVNADDFPNPDARSLIDTSATLYHQPLRATNNLARPRYQGTLKSFSEANNFGFIRALLPSVRWNPNLGQCPGNDVFLHGSQRRGAEVGNTVSFAISLNKRGQAQAHDLQREEPLDDSDGSMRHSGLLRSFSVANNFGFIEALHLPAKWQHPKLGQRDNDVFLHGAQRREIKVGSTVSFTISLNQRGQPQARDLQEMPDDARFLGPRPTIPTSGRNRATSHDTEPRSDTDSVIPVAEISSRLGATVMANLVDAVTCVICHEVCHRATCVQPCLHNFCSHCLGKWLWKASGDSLNCPICREPITQITRNSTIEKLIDQLLELDPDRRRLDKAEMDAEDCLQDVQYDLSRLRELRGLLQDRRRQSEELYLRLAAAAARGGLTD